MTTGNITERSGEPHVRSAQFETAIARQCCKVWRLRTLLEIEERQLAVMCSHAPSHLFVNEVQSR